MQYGSAFFGLAVVVSGAALAGLACARNRSGFGDESKPPPLVSEDAGDVVGLPECRESLLCSRDLKRVLLRHCDGTEEVVRECGPDLGCGDGACVDPCKSAELSKGSLGCSFATLPPDAVTGYDRLPGACFAAMIANVWERPVTLQAMLGDEPIDIGPSTYYAESAGADVNYSPVGGPIAPGKVAIVFLAHSDGSLDCPKGVVPALQEDPIAHGTTRTRAFRLTTDAPVSAYSIWPYGGARSYVPTATLLLPISSWDRNYIAVSTWSQPGSGLPAPVDWPFIQIVAAEDNTEVRMRPNVTVVGGSGVPGITAGQTQTWMLGRGEVLQIKQAQDTSGSPIETSKPVGLFGGSDCTHIPTNTLACDTTQQQIPPVSQWGTAYALAPYRSRNDWGAGTTTAREVVPWRFVGAANGTKLTYDPAPPAGAPETLEAGQVVTFMSSELATVRSQDAEHPFYAAMFMTGAWSFPRQIGDPDFVNIVPSEQFLDRYVFFTDYTYANTTLALVRRKTMADFHPVIVECAGEITDWTPIGNDGEYEFTWVYLTKDGAPQRFAGGTCGNGRHEAHSDGPFSVHVWGMDRAASYGYAGGQGSRPLSNVKGPPVS